MEKLCEAPHVHADFQPARFVSRLQGILLPNTGRDGSVANFCFNSIFEFFNRIGKKATSAGPEKFDPCLSLGAGLAVPIDYGGVLSASKMARSWARSPLGCRRQPSLKTSPDQTLAERRCAGLHSGVIGQANYSAFSGYQRKSPNYRRGQRLPLRQTREMMSG
jgi:hypothetical protein